MAKRVLEFNNKEIITLYDEHMEEKKKKPDENHVPEFGPLYGV